jgi:putative tryptophan/tyrosine transport system substrate-binding protein
MKRREFITLVGGIAATWPLAAEAQQSNRVKHVGVLFGRARNDPEGQAHAQVFEQEMQKLGWAQDHNVRFDYRWAAGDAERISTFAKEIVDARPDVIVGHTTAAVAALLRETRTIPIVFVAVTDPIGSGFVASLSRPGGNVTGFIDLEPSLGSKWVELLKQMVPNLTRLGCMFNPMTAAGGGSYSMGSVETAASSLGVKAVANARSQCRGDRARSYLPHRRSGWGSRCDARHFQRDSSKPDYFHCQSSAATRGLRIPFLRRERRTGVVWDRPH